MKIITLSLVFFLSACSAFHMGYYNEYQQYVPKHPKFTLKGRMGMVKPKKLDLENLYKLEKKVYQGLEIYPIDSTMVNPNFEPLFNTEIYLKFLPNGRCYSFSKKSHNKQNQKIPLMEKDLDTTNPHISKQYYFSEDENKILIESFVPAEGNGKYIIKNAILEEEGQKIIIHYDTKDASSYDIFKKVIIPIDWNNVQVDW